MLLTKNFRKKIQYHFKRFFQLFFKLIYGKINQKISPNSSEKISVKKIKLNNQNYNIYIIKEGRIYTDRVNDTAIILDNKIVEGPSYQLRSLPGDELSPRTNSTVKNNIVITKGTPRFKKNFDNSILSLLSGGGANKNYFHWLFDVLPRIGIVEGLTHEDFPYYLLCPEFELPFQIQTLHLLGFEKKHIISSKFFRHVQSKKLMVTDHPYNISENIKLNHENIPSWISKWLRDKFLKFKENKMKYDKIYIDRRDVDPYNLSNRRIQNEVELKEFLRSSGYEFVRLQELKFTEQIGLFHSAKKIIGLHGAGFANLAFCQPGTAIIELRTTSTFKIIESIAKHNNLNFRYLEYNPIHSRDKQNGVINISLETLKKII